MGLKVVLRLLAEQAGGGLVKAMGDGLVRGARAVRTRPARASGVPVVRGGLIERLLRDGLGSREVEGRGRIEVELGLGRTLSRGHPGGPMWEIEMEEDALHGGGQGDEGDDPHVAAAGGAQEREHLLELGQELGPEHEARS